MEVLNFKYKNLNLEIPHKNLLQKFCFISFARNITKMETSKTKEIISALIHKLPEEARKVYIKD